MKYYDEKTDEINWRNVGVTLFGIMVFFIVVTVPLWYLRAASSVVTSPARVLDATMTTQNILDSYEDFRDTYQAYNSRVAQIHDFEKQKPTDKDDAAQLRTELAGQRQSCRDIVARYNSQSSKANHNIFKLGGGSLPNELDMGECDQ